MRSVVFVLLLIFFASCGSKGDHNPEAAGVELDFEVPGDLTPSVFREKHLPNGDGYTLSVFKLDDATLGKLLNQFTGKKSRQLPFPSNAVIDNRILEFVDDTDLGYYLLDSDEEDPRDMVLIVLNRSKMTLVILRAQS